MKKNLQRCLFGLAFLLFAGVFTANAQEVQVTGKVTDGETGEGLVGVTIVEVGTSNGTITDFDGNYSLSVGSSSSLSYSFVGYVTQEVAVGSQTTINVALALDVKQLQEIVVTGYATQDKKDLTTAVGIVDAEDLTDIPVGNVANQLQGRVAGVTVTGSGQPGSTAKVRIRGISSWGNNSPLYVIDGVQTQDISTLNPNDVESVSVLKDAGAAAIYGARGSNGVIVITTKGGVSSGVSVNYSMFTGLQDPGKGPNNLLDAQGHADLTWLVYKNDDLTGDPSTNDPAIPDDDDNNDINDGEVHPYLGNSWDPNPTLPGWAGNTNWYNEVTETAPITNHDLSLSGGNESARFYAGLNYFDQNGIVKTTGMKRFSARLNSEYKIKDRVTIGEHLQLRHRTQYGAGFNNLSEANVISDVYRTMSIIPVRMTSDFNGLSHDFKTGDWGGTGIAARLGNGSNGVADLTRSADNLDFDVRVMGDVYADVKIMEGVNFKSSFGGTLTNGYYSNYTFATYELSENVATPTLSEGAYYSGDWVWTNTLSVSKQFDDHSINAVAGYEALKFSMGRGVNGVRSGYFSDNIPYRTLSNGETITNATSYNNTPVAVVSQFARVDYSYSDKYLFSASVRRDGSSLFNNQYAVFPSFSAGWRLSDEAFLQGNEFITELKVRGGYGTIGNILNVPSLNKFLTYGGSASTSNYDLNGTGNSSIQGFRAVTIPNEDAIWETNITSNFGFDAGLLDNKLEVIFDLYSKRTVDLLWTQELSGFYGGADVPAVNIAEMLNTGVDVQTIYRDNINSDLSFEANLTFTTYNNQIVNVSESADYFDAGGSRIGTFTRNQVGGASSAFFGYEVVGLWQSDQEVADANALDGDASTDFQDGAEPGFFRYADINGDGVISGADRTIIGDPNPDFTYGLNLSVNYKNFDVTAFIYGSKGNEIFNYTRWWTDFWQSFQGQKSTDLLSNSWTPENTSATTPKASNNANFSNNQTANTYYVEDGSYLRLKNLQIGYNLPTNIISNAGLSSAKVYVQGINLFTMTKYSGLDPELGGSDSAFGIDYGNYPTVKQFLIGVNLGF